MSKKQKITLVSVFVGILVVAGILAAVLNVRKTQDGTKKFQVEIISERDDYAAVEDCESTEEFLGAFLRTYEPCEWEDSDYGIYVSGFHGMKEDIDNQYWWCVTVNGEESATGADQIPLEEGSKYTFTLKQGW